MPTNGYIRKLDNLGRFVIPKAIRYTRGWKPGTEVEIFVNESDEIIVRKHKAKHCINCGEGISERYHFCPICGTEQTIKEEENYENK